MVLDHVADDAEVHVLVEVDDHVSEARHLLEASGEFHGHDAGPAEKAKHVAVRVRFPEAVVRNDVRADVERRLDRELERVLDETLLPQVFRDPLGAGQRPQLADAGLDEGEPLGDELGVGHRRGSATRPAEAVAGAG